MIIFSELLLANFILTSATQLTKAWLQKVYETIPKSRDFDEVTVVDSLEKYLLEVGKALLSPRPMSSATNSLQTAREHGHTRIKLNYSVRDIATEYTLLRETIISEASKVGELTAETSAELCRMSDAGLINAVEEFLSTTIIESERLARLAAEQAKKQLHDFFMQAPEPMVIMSGQEHTFTVANQPYVQFIGRDPVGKKVRDVFSDEEAGEFVAILDHVYQSSIPYIGKEMPFRKKNDAGEMTDHWINIGYYPAWGGDGKVSGIHAFVHDVTDQVSARKKVEAANRTIERERENFENLFEQTPEMVCVLEGPDHRFRFVNLAHIKALGFNATGKTVREAQPESVEIHIILDGVFRTGVTAELFEIPVTVTDRVRYFNLTYAARRDLEDRIDGVMVLGTEVTDLVLNRETLKLQGQALELSMADAPLSAVLEVMTKLVELQAGGALISSVLLADKEEKQLSHGAAPGLPALYNAAVDGIAIGANMGSCGTSAITKRITIVTDIMTDPLWEDFKELAAGHGLRACWSVPILSSRDRLLGTFACYSKTPREPSARELQIVSVAAQTTALIIERRLEIEERILSGREAERAREELYSFFMQAPAPMVIFSGADHHFTLANPTYEKFVGRKVMGLSLAEVFSEEEVGAYRERLDCVYRTGEPFVGRSLPLALKGDDGAALNYRIDVSYTPFRDSKGDIRGILVFIQDVTEQFHARTSLETHNRELSEAKLDADRANEAKSVFLANMSHEIRTPLGAISGFADLARLPGTSNAETASYLGIIERNAFQVLKIIDDILDLAKVEAGKVEIETMEVSLAEFLADFASLVGFRARENGIAFQIDAETDLPNVICTDPTRLRQILTNAVGNAIKFTVKGSVSVRVFYKDHMLSFRVADTGRGISKAQAKGLFQAFTQADVSTTRKFGGTGLGLVLTKRLCQLLGGDYLLEESELGVGSKFVASIKVKLPVVSKMVSKEGVLFGTKAEIALPIQRGRLDNISVLLVEDSPDNQNLVRLILEKQGARLEIVSDGMAGVERALAGSHDLVLMDIQMPRMDGYEAVKTLRQKGYAKPVVAFTAHAMKDETDRAKNSGFTDFLSKPIQREFLVAVVAHHCGK